MSGSVGARILSVGEHRPARAVSNVELPLSTPVDDNWVYERTGIKSRRYADVGESVVTMAADAAGEALAEAGISGDDLDLVILTSCSKPTPIPGGAGELAHLIGAMGSAAFDLNSACAGFCYSLAIAADAVRQGTATYVLVAASERLSDWIDWTDHRSAILFGDGAAAVIVGPSDDDGIGPVVWGSDGSGAGFIAAPTRGQLEFDGPAVFRWATTTMVGVATRACEVANVDPNELFAIVPHQANARITAVIARGIGAESAVVVNDIEQTGNTSSASVPLALSRLVSESPCCSDRLALLIGFGAGLAWAAQVVRLP